MEFFEILEKIAIFVVLISVMVLLAAYLRRYQFGNIALSVGKDSKLRLEESLVIDASNKIVVVSYGDTQYILHIGHSSTLIDKITKIRTPNLD